MPDADEGDTDSSGPVSLELVLARRWIGCVYQPIVELATGAVVAFEGLARGPRGSGLESPDRLFAAARRERRLADLDRACRSAAIAGAQAGDLLAPWTLFLNLEAEAAAAALRSGHTPSGDPRRGGGSQQAGLRVVLELTERALTADPAQLLQLVARTRSRGWGVALDDVGADRDSLALLPLLCPDVIKLDLRLIQGRPGGDVAEILSAVNAEAERSGATVLAEGIETEEHLAVARSLGATLAQGWLLGRPGPLPGQLPPFTGLQIPIASRGAPVTARTPFELGAVKAAPRLAAKELLTQISTHLERQAGRSGEATVVLACFQDEAFFTPAARRRYAGLASTAAFVGALGQNMPPEPLAGVRGGVLRPGDPLAGEWNLAVVGPHYAAALVARDLGDDGPDPQRRFEYVLSHDRGFAIMVANALISRISPRPRLADLPVLPGSPPRQANVRLKPITADPPAHSVDSQLLTEAPDLLHRALAAISAGIAIVIARPPDFPLVYVNDGFQVITGHTRQQALGQSWRLLHGPGTDPRAVREMSHALAHGQALTTRILNYRADGTAFWNEVQLHPMPDHDGALSHYITVGHDVTARVEAEDRLAQLAYLDQLTGLPNHAALADAIGRALARGRRLGTATALLLIHLDGLDHLNDEYGHEVTNAVLRRLAHRMQAASRGNDVLARHHADEFVLLLTDLEPQHARPAAARVAANIRRTLDRPLDIHDLTPTTTHITLATFIGLSVAPADATTTDQFLRSAHTAMTQARLRGFAVDLGEQAAAPDQSPTDLDRLDRGEII